MQLRFDNYFHSKLQLQYNKINQIWYGYNKLIWYNIITLIRYDMAYMVTMYAYYNSALPI